MRTLCLALALAGIAIPPVAHSQEWEPSGLYGGWPTDMTLDEDERIVVTASRGGVYRKPNPDAQWERILDDPDLDPRSVATGAGGRIYVGTDGFANTGFIRSTNDGTTWHVLINELSGEIVNDIRVEPDNQTLWACTFGDGLYRSSNGGTTFSSVASLPTSYPAFIESNAPGHFFVGVQFGAVNLYYSSNNGTTWQPRDTGIASDVNAVHVDPSNGHLYAADGTKLYKSTDNGLTWTSLGAPAGSYSDVEAYENRIYGARYSGFLDGGKVVYTDDGGAHWTEDSGLPGQALRGFLSTPDWLYLGVTGPGPYRRGGAGTGWEPNAEGMTNVFVRAIVPDETNGLVHVVAENLGIFSSTDGTNWTPTDFPPYEFVYSMITAPNGDLFASGSYDGIYRSTDAGGSWTNVYGVGATALGANDLGHVFAGNGSWMYRSTNGGNNWSQLASLPGVQGIPDIACTGNEVYVATGYFQFGGQGVFRSTNGGNTFSAFNSGLTNLNVTSLGIDPDAGADCEISAGTRSGLYDLDGVTWNLNASYGLGEVKKVRKSMDRRVVVEEVKLSVASALSCIWEEQTGANRYNADFGTHRISQRRAGEEPEFVQLLGTYGDGVYRMGGAPPTDAAEHLPSSTGTSLSVRRNPFVGSTTLELVLEHPGAANVDVFDAAGRKVATLVDGWTQAGRQSVPWNAEGLAAGVYFARLSIGDSVRTQRLVLLR